MRMVYGRSRPRGATASRGFATLVTLIMGIVLVGIVLAVADVSVTQTRLSSRGEQRATALFLADAGVDDAVVHLTSDHGWAGQSVPETLYADPDTNSIPTGSFTSTAALSDDRFSAVVHTQGTNTGPGSSKVVAVFAFAPMYFADVAIRAKDDVLINGTATITTVSGKSDADIWSGGNIVMNSSASVEDGSLFAVGTITSPMPGSQGIVSVNPNYGTVPAFPNPDVLQAQLQAAAGGATSAQPAKTVFTTKKGAISATVTAPAYINGDLTMNNGDSVTFQGTGVIYINGSIDLRGGTLTNSVVGTVAVADSISMNGGATYLVSIGTEKNADGSLIVPTLAAFNGGSDTGNAITLNGLASTTQQGVLYAANGDFQLNGNNALVAALVAGNGSVTTTGSLTMLYPDSLRSTDRYPGRPQLIFWGEEQ